MYSELVISVDELWLKGKNRKDYLKKLMNHIQSVIRLNHPEHFICKILSQRLFYSSHLSFAQDTVDALLRIPGIASISPSTTLKRLPDEKLDNLYEEILKQLSHLTESQKTFRASVRRIDQSYSKTSVDIEKKIGHFVLIQYPLAKVDLKKPEILIDVRIHPKAISLSMITWKGVGGLPAGSTGFALTMISGGFDSPVASYMMAKRGVRQGFVFFHAYPFVGREVLSKIKKLVSNLAHFQNNSHFYIIPFGDIQQFIAEHAKAEYRTLFFRRYMLECTSNLCLKAHAQALITGDSLAQVSSQSLKNMQLLDRSIEPLIFRPLIGLNKLEIINTAKMINTYDISAIPHDDACSLFSSDKPIINPRKDYWDNWLKDPELQLAFSDKISTAIQNLESFSVNPKGEFFKKDFFSFDS